MNIVLIGFRGAGKTTVGKRLAEKLNLEFIDADDFIERKYGFSISELFQTKGESLFRLLESDVINELSKLDSRIIAAGGGAVLKYKNIKNLKRHGIIILLEADGDTVYQRIQADDKTKTQRPQLTGNELYREIKELMEFRKSYYQRAADYTIDTTNKSVDTTLEEIYQILRERGFVNI